MRLSVNAANHDQLKTFKISMPHAAAIVAIGIAFLEVAFQPQPVEEGAAIVTRPAIGAVISAGDPALARAAPARDRG